jgi:hypothetical protein
MINKKQAKKALEDFSPRGSNCPICKKNFRYGCSHSVLEAKSFLYEQYIKSIIKEEK